MIMSAEDYAAKASGSFVLPDACFKVKALIEDESATIEDFANVISVDPSLTSRLLKMANSAIYQFVGEISTISRAITIIGTQAIYNLMLIDVATTAFKQFSTKAIDLKRFWRVSVFCGLATKNIAIKAGIRDIERLFVAGLLHNLGELIVAAETPEKATLAEFYNEDTYPWQLQQQLLGFSYTDISALLLKAWQIPEKIILPIRHLHQASSIDINLDIKVLYIANQLALIDSHPDLYSFEQLVADKNCHSIGITIENLERSSEFAAKETDSILSIMNSTFFTPAK